MVEPLPAVLAALGLEDGPEARAILAGSEAEASIKQAPTAAAVGSSSLEPADDSGAASADEMTCSICLQHTELEEIASVKGCHHTYCVKCILRWAAHREAPTCPQCKAPFDYLVTYYRLDGSLNDFPCEESVCLLKRAQFFVDYMQTVDKGKWRLSAEDGGGGWADYEQYYQEYDDDEEVEAYYFSAAAGRARVTLGNRRWGENGYVASGHQRGRPVTRAGGKGKGASAAAASAAGTSSSSTPAPAPASGGKGGRRRRNKAVTSPEHASADAAAPVASTSVPDPAGGSSGGGCSGRHLGGCDTTTPITMRRLSGRQPSAPSGSEADGPVMGTSPLGSSPGSSVPGTGRRAKRNSRRVVEDMRAGI